MVRQIHEWSWKLVQDRHFETEAKTKTSSAETKTKTKTQKIGLEQSQDQDRGLEDYKTACLSKLSIN